MKSQACSSFDDARLESQKLEPQRARRAGRTSDHDDCVETRICHPIALCVLNKSLRIAACQQWEQYEVRDGFAKCPLAIPHVVNSAFAVRRQIAIASSMAVRRMRMVGRPLIK